MKTGKGVWWIAGHTWGHRGFDEVEVGGRETAHFGVAEDFDGGDVFGGAEGVDREVSKGVGDCLEFDGW